MSRAVKSNLFNFSPSSAWPAKVFTASVGAETKRKGASSNFFKLLPIFHSLAGLVFSGPEFGLVCILFLAVDPNA